MAKLSRRQMTNLKIAAATATCIFTLATAFTGTLAWFTMNQEVSTTGMSVTVATTSSVNILSCYAVRYDGNYGAIAYDISSGNSNVTMSEYDYIFTDRNVNTPLFLRIELTNFDTNKDLTVTIPSTGAYKNGSVIEPYLSNVISAQFLTGLKSGSNIVPDEYDWSGSEVHNADVVSAYQGMLAHASDSVGTPFVTGNTKNGTISLTLESNVVFANGFVLTKQDAQDNDIDVVVIYIALDYHVTDSVNLVTSYLDSYNGASHELSFTSDIHTISLNNEGNA